MSKSPTIMDSRVQKSKSFIWLRNLGSSAGERPPGEVVTKAGDGSGPAAALFN